MPGPAQSARDVPPPAPRRAIARPHACRHCGAPAAREGGVCPEPACRAEDARRRAARNRAARRPVPAPQADPTLPRLGELVAEDDGSGVQCHVCGRVVVLLAAHAWAAHGLRAAEYRERYGLARGTALAAPVYRAAKADLARDRGFGAGLVPRRGGAPAGMPRRLESRVRASRSRRPDDATPAHERGTAPSSAPAPGPRGVRTERDRRTDDIGTSPPPPGLGER